MTEIEDIGEQLFIKEIKILREQQANQTILKYLQQGSNLSSLMKFMRQHWKQRAMIVIKYILPLMNEVKLHYQSKTAILSLLESIFQNPQQNMHQIILYFQHSQTNCSLQGLRQFTLVQYLIKLISLPAVFANILCQLNFGSESLTKQRASYKEKLFVAILEGIQQCQIEQKLMIINKLLLQGEENIVINYYINNNGKIIVQNFAALSKQSNIIRYLYIQILANNQSNQADKTDEIIDILQTIVNQNDTLSYVMQLLNYGEIKIFAGQNYRKFVDIFKVTLKSKAIFQQLLKWWSVGKNHIVGDNHARVRCNILALLLKNQTKESLINSDYTLCITEGIKKRLTDGNGKDFAMLIWKIMAEIMELPLSEQIQKADFLEIIDNSVTQLSSQSVSRQSIQQKKSQNYSKKQSNLQQQKQQHQQANQFENEDDVIIIKPKNIYDCILGLRNPHRCILTIKILPQIINKYKQDLALMWNSLLRQLLTPLKQQYKQILILLFNIKPIQFVESVVTFFSNRSNNVCQKIWMMDALAQGIQQIVTKQEEEIENENQTQFYFKKVKSKYINQETTTKIQKQDKSRRWGHTRIAFENKSKENQINLKIVPNSCQINRFYMVANELFFKIIDVMAIDLIQSLRKHQILVQHLLKLLSVFTSNIKNHFDKYLVLLDISQMCSNIIGQLKQSKDKKETRYQQNGGQTLMLTLQVINKLALVIDHYVPDSIMSNLKRSIQNAKQMPNYGMSAVIQMIESNIYQRVYQQSS